LTPSQRAARPSSSAVPAETREAAVAVARAASEKQAVDIRILEVRELIVITDYFVICSGATERQVRTIVDEIDKTMAKLGMKAIRREGEREGRWVLLDFGDVVAHVFAAEERVYYELERLWKDAPEIAWSESNDSVDARTGSSNAGGGAAATGTASSTASTSTTGSGRRRART
jgi:ribosome-associated protein